MKMKNSITNLMMALSVFLMISATSCHKTDSPDPNPDQKSMKDLVINPNFKFRTTRPVSIDITLPFTVDYSEINGRVDIYYQYQDELYRVYSGVADHDGHLLASFDVPEWVNEVFVKSMGGEIKVELDKTLKSTLDGIYVNFGDLIDTLPPRLVDSILLKRSSLKLSLISSGWENINNSLSHGKIKNSSVIIDNLLSNGDFSINDFGEIEDWDFPIPQDGRWYITSAIHNKVDLYSENGNSVLQIRKPSHNIGGVAQQIPAYSGELITVNAKAKVSGFGQKYIWIYLNPRNAQGQVIDQYAILDMFPSQSWKNYEISATMPTGTVSCDVLLWVNIYGSSINYVYFDDIVATGPNPDSDGDAVIDTEDEYPNDPQRAFNFYYPSNNSFASIAFEDNWPYTGDYDFNDLVMDYQYQLVLNTNFKLVDLYGKFVVKSIGASFKNGFGFEINMDPLNVANIMGQSITQNYITLNANNTEAGQTKTVVIVSDNLFTQLPHPGSGTGVNTSPSAPYVEPDTLEIHLSTVSPVSVDNPPFNPFLIVNKQRDREIHLIDKAPTNLVNFSLFGTGSDASIPASNTYYKTANFLPWAIEYPFSFDYPIEKAAINQAFLKFVNWAESSGTEYSDWYLPNIPGYRDESLIYSPQ